MDESNTIRSVVSRASARRWAPALLSAVVATACSDEARYPAQQQQLDLDGASDGMQQPDPGGAPAGMQASNPGGVSNGMQQPDPGSTQSPVEGMQASDPGGAPDGTPSEPGAVPEVPPPQSAPGKLILVSQRVSPEATLQYLHVLDDWPESKSLDYSQAIELQEFPNVTVFGDAVYVHQPDTARVRKLVLGANGQLQEEAVISFELYGAASFDAELIFASAERAYLVDEASAQIISWNPSAMTITGAVDIDASLLERDGLPGQLQQGVAVGGRVFTAVNWRNWDTYEYHPAAAIGFFDATQDQPSLTVIEDDRCAPSVGLSPFVGDDGDVYLVSDAALGFDAIASTNKTTLPLCVLRMQPGADSFDASFEVDLRAITGSPGFYTAHPMSGNRLLANIWAPDVDPSTVGNPEDPSWYWENQPYFEYAIVDLEAKTSIPVPALPRAAVQFSKTLRVDGINYVQLYREDAGSTLNRVDPDGTATEVLSNGSGTDVQYVGRLAAPSQAGAVAP